ncbi:MAG TPA: signal peptidase I [Feifaniaceae bacterium]|nr:signal peptidase I [Feifaniaceae bacterium]
MQISRAAHKHVEYARHSLFSWLFVLLEVIAALAALFLLVLFPVRVSGSSMAPTLQQGEILLIDRLTLFFRSPRRGDLVIFENPSSGEELIKRVVALPGETVEIVNGAVYIDGRMLDESAYSPSAAKDFEPAVVPENCVFVLGDDRAGSLDSRDPALGAVPFGLLDGKVRVRVSPLNRAALFG